MVHIWPDISHRFADWRQANEKVKEKRPNKNKSNENIQIIIYVCTYVHRYNYVRTYTMYIASLHTRLLSIRKMQYSGMHC